MFNFIDNLFFFDEIKDSDDRILLFIDIANNLTMMNVLSSFELWFIEIYFFILLFNFTILNGKVMNVILFGHYQNLFFTDETNAEEITVIEGIFLC